MVWVILGGLLAFFGIIMAGAGAAPHAGHAFRPSGPTPCLPPIDDNYSLSPEDWWAINDYDPEFTPREYRDDFGDSYDGGDDGNGGDDSDGF